MKILKKIKIPPRATIDVQTTLLFKKIKSVWLLTISLK